MLSYCLKCKKKTESKNLWLQKQKNENQCFCQNVQCVAVKNQDLLKSKKLVDYLVN